MHNIILLECNNYYFSQNAHAIHKLCVTWLNSLKFRTQTVEKVSAVCVKKISALVTQHCVRKRESTLLSSPNWLAII